MSARSLLAFALVLSSARALAEKQNACFDAPVAGQKLRKAGKLLAAREQFLACAQKECPAEIVEDCAKWSSEVETALPSVVVAARDPQGRDLEGATVAVDGGAFAPLGTRALRLDPDKHTIVVRTASGAEGQRDVTLHEGEHDRPVVLTFGAQGVLEEPKAQATRPIPTYVWVTGGAGALGLVSFGVFGTLGLISRSSNHCDIGCVQSDKSVVDTEFAIADASLVVGLVAAGAATILYLLRPHVVTTHAATGPRFWGFGGRF